jgi:hypothetical protein
MVPIASDKAMSSNMIMMQSLGTAFAEDTIVSEL